eukprot:m.295208 g.295208  ORF g.295208 m.295208 type:complete len:250 (-) comp20037_c0_seq15:526-1275(-)
MSEYAIGLYLQSQTPKARFSSHMPNVCSAHKLPRCVYIANGIIWPSCPTPSEQGIKRGWFGVEDLPYTLGGPVPRRTFQAPASPTLRQQQESQAFMRAAVAAMASASHPKHAFTQSNSHPKYNFARDMDASRQSRHTGARETTAPHPQDQHQWQAPPPARDPTSQATHQRIGASITPPAGNGTRYLFYTVVSSTGGCCAEKNALGAVRLYSVLARHSISFYFIYCATSCQMLISTVCLYCDSEQSWRRN